MCENFNWRGKKTFLFAWMASFFFIIFAIFSFSLTLPCKSLVGKYSTGCFFVLFWWWPFVGILWMQFISWRDFFLVLSTCKALALKLICCWWVWITISIWAPSFSSFLTEEYFVPIADLGTHVANLNRTFLSALVDHLTNACLASLLQYILHSLLSSGQTW